MLPFEIEKRLTEIKNEITLMGAELVDISVHRSGPRSVLTVLVDKTGGVTLEDCVAINQRLGSYFDSLEGGSILGGAYFLEVNSPGLDRPLRTPHDFERALHERVRLHYPDERGIVQAHVGEILSVVGDTVEMNEEKGKVRTLRYFSVPSIVKAVREIGFK